MKGEINRTDERLGNLLQAAKPVGELNPGFQNRVWQRIENGQEASLGTFGWLAAWLLRPRVAAGALAALLILAAGFGAMRGIQAGDQIAQDRYLASVDPAYSGK